MDSRTSVGNGLIRTDSANKFKFKDDLLFVCCGVISDIELAVANYPNKLPDVDTEYDFVALMVKDDAVYMVTNFDGIFNENLVEHDIGLGSGGDFALAAMDHGQNAVGAIMYAKTRNMHTGGVIRSYKIGDKDVITNV